MAKRDLPRMMLLSIPESGESEGILLDPSGHPETNPTVAFSCYQSQYLTSPMLYLFGFGHYNNYGY